MQRHLPTLLALLALGACATSPQAQAPQTAPAPALTPPAAEADVGYAQKIQQEATAQIAAEPADALPQGLTVTVTNVDMSDGKLAFEAELRAPRQGARRDRQYVIFGRCGASDLPACGHQVVIGARLLKLQETAAP